MPQMLPFVLLMFVFSLLIPQVHNHYHTITKVKPVAMPVRIAVPAPPPKVVTHFATRHGRRHADRGRWRGGETAGRGRYGVMGGEGAFPHLVGT